MKIKRKLNVAFMLAIVCLVLMIMSSYAWLTISLQPKVYSIDTNVGANGSLEIALLTEQTFADPLQIRTTVGSSIAEQDALEANKSWGNVIDLSDARYGLEQITLLPARLNVTYHDTQYVVDKSLIKTANYGADGRITILSEQTVSTILGTQDFTFYVDRQLYGVRAIGSISSLTSQQIALAQARSLAKSYTATASRTVKHTWRDLGSCIMDILYQRYATDSDSFTADDVGAIRDLANGLLEVTGYVESALRQGIIGVAASQITDEPEFEEICALVENENLSLSEIVDMLGGGSFSQFQNWVQQLENLESELQWVVLSSFTMENGGTWDQIESLLDVMLDAENIYIEEQLLSDKTSFAGMTEDNELLISPGSGAMAELAAFVGNYSAFANWKQNVSVALRTADPNEPSYLIQMEKILESCKAASGGWTRANMDDIYAYAVDLALRCNEPSELLLQTIPMLRIDEKNDIPVTQGSGSYMRFTSDNMDTEQLLLLMDAIRIGFIDDKNTLLGVAKLNISNYEEQDEGIFAPLYLYEYTLEQDGALTLVARLQDDAAILELPQNSPVILTVVVWLDGDQVNNSMVSDSVNQSMNGVLNLQFSSSADLVPSQQPIG